MTPKDRMKVEGEPVVLFALVEHDLQAAHGECQKAEADVVEIEEVFAVGFIQGGSWTRRWVRTRRGCRQEY
jgi:hypothetical protein